ncbi:hypothetical protein BIV57_04840 [Mangrovactinospora gilvigrisea]|uniref:HTH marR-type domain-containing protein n=1 Tax=Mangrovactinospora gilvigrisea TaxID=1428644 RepID=A0A1J7CAP2_9ACTN|nr:MarR family transcriptional regulator [Mangrovactinospora gilvigrisea]OIV38584.1 hypothetical protein BIV57_04840 [Mangrovactinospora gilvigrisea]
MATSETCAELVLQLGALGAIRRGMIRAARGLPEDGPELHPAAYGVLAMLGKYGRLRLSELSDLLDVDLSVTSRHISHLAKRGLVARHRDADDRRSRVIALTDEGTAALDQLMGRYAGSVAERLRDWSDEDVARLAELIARLRASFEPHPHRTIPQPLTAER